MAKEEFADVNVLLECIMLLTRLKLVKRIWLKAKLTQQMKQKKSYQNGFANFIKEKL